MKDALKYIGYLCIGFAIIFILVCFYLPLMFKTMTWFEKLIEVW